MRRKFYSKKYEKGQVIIIVALALVALIAMAALIVDGALIMSHRRTAQAAADAAALAGAEYLCPNVYSESDAIDEAEDYVGLNNAEIVDISISDEYENTIHVETRVGSTSFFSRIFAQTALNATAVSEASCSALSSGVGILPIGFPCYPTDEYFEYPDPLYDSEGNPICYLKYGDKTKDVAWHIANDKMMIVMDTEDDPDSYCYPAGPINCDEYEHDGSILVGEANKSWIDLSGPDQDDLCEWMSDGFEGMILENTWLSGTTGTRSNLFTVAGCLPDFDNEYIVPIFNEFCRGHDPEIQCPEKWQEGDIKLLSSGMDLTYRISSFAYFKITCMDGPGKKDCPYRQHLIDEDILYNDNNAKSISSIEGYFIKGTVPIGGGDGVDTGLYTVHLRR